MSFKDTFLNGEQGLFKPNSLTPMQKLALRFVVMGVLYYGLSAVEGMIMRMYEIAPFVLVAVGTIIFWLAGFINHYAPLYTLYWPLPADFSQFNPVGGAICHIYSRHCPGNGGCFVFCL